MNRSATFQTQAPMTTEEVWRRLIGHHEGRLKYASGHGPRSLVVTYAVSGSGVLIRLANFNEACQYMPDRRVTLEVAGHGEWDNWTVRLSGVAERLTTRQARVRNRLLTGEEWPAGMDTTTFYIPGDRLRGTCTADS